MEKKKRSYYRYIGFFGYYTMPLSFGYELQPFIRWSRDENGDIIIFF